MDELDRFNLAPAVRPRFAALMSSLIQQNNGQLVEKNIVYVSTLESSEIKIASLP